MLWPPGRHQALAAEDGLVAQHSALAAARGMLMEHPTAKVEGGMMMEHSSPMAAEGGKMMEDSAPKEEDGSFWDPLGIKMDGDGAAILFGRAPMAKSHYV